MVTLMDELLTVVFWAITYLLIVYAGFRSRSLKQVSMPYTAGVLNFAWELCAVIDKSGYWAYVLWLVIDIAIVCIGFFCLKSAINKVAYGSALLFCTVGLLFAFNLTNGFVYTVYAIDLLMAICFLVERKRLSPVLKLPIAITRLLGDFFAGFVFCRYPLVTATAVIVLVLNVVYVCLCIREKYRLAT